MSSPEPLQGSIISAFKDCDEETIAKIRHYFTIWGELLLDDPAPLTDEELEEHSDQLIFGTWDSDIRPREPAFQAPQVSQTRLQIGHFNQDLPKSTKAEAKWAEGLEHELFDLRVDLNKYNQFFPERKAGQPAFVRARPEYLQQQLAVPFDFIDRKGNWAPVGCIDFGTPGNKPSDILLASACKRAETAWANACDDWNYSLCVHLCRLDLYNKS
ncbi:hypothetical protein KJ359_007530 [Pestalotiopsis sp. 9143b]|nr:hypothetical protein KJ359_007530 [Pestalotiopsis sp. 9143b]